MICCSLLRLKTALESRNYFAKGMQEADAPGIIFIPTYTSHTIKKNNLIIHGPFRLRLSFVIVYPQDRVNVLIVYPQARVNVLIVYPQDRVNVLIVYPQDRVNVLIVYPQDRLTYSKSCVCLCLFFCIIYSSI